MSKTPNSKPAPGGASWTKPPSVVAPLRGTTKSPGHKKKAEKLITLRDFEKAAKKILPKMALDYYRSGSDDERALRRNLDAFSEYVV